MIARTDLLRQDSGKRQKLQPDLMAIPTLSGSSMTRRKKKQEDIKDLLGDEYQDYNLVFATSFGLPYESASLRKSLDALIKEHDLPKIVFHSLRHTSITYKLKLNGEDIKAVQGDSGHSQVNMVTDVYAHILDEDRRHNAELFEEAFYRKKDADPRPADLSSTLSSPGSGKPVIEVLEGVDPELLKKVLRQYVMTSDL